MRITHVATTPGGAAVAAARGWNILTPAGAPGLRTFQQVLYLRFATGGDADGIRIDAGKTKLRATFRPISYDARNPPVTALAAAFTNAPQNTVHVVLDAPRQITQVQMVNTFAPGGNAALEFYRLDGETPSETPSATASFGGGLVDQIALSPSLGIGDAFAPRAMPRPAEVPAQAAAANAAGGFAVKKQSLVLAQANVAWLATEFTDVRFALCLKNAPALQANQIAALTIRSYPSGPRLGLAAPADPAAAIFFARLDGEIGKAPENRPGGIDAQAGNAFAAALQRHLDDVWTQFQASGGSAGPPDIPSQIDVALAIVSDAPCVVQIDDFAVEYGLVRHAFPGLEEKITLRFDGDAVATQAVALRLPAAAQVTHAALEVNASFGSDRPVAGIGANGSEPGLSAAAAGLHLRPERWVGQPITPQQAIAVSGVALGLMALTGGTRLLLALREDHQGQPTGKQLAEATLVLEKGGQRTWKMLSFPGAVVLASQPYWLLLRAVEGAAVWLSAAGETGASLFEAGGAGGVGATCGAIPQRVGLFYFLSATAAAGVDSPAPPLAVAVGATAVAVPAQAGDKLTYDLAAALNAYLATATGNSVEVPIQLTTGLAGSVTVYPPEVVFDPGTS